MVQTAGLSRPQTCRKHMKPVSERNIASSVCETGSWKATSSQWMDLQNDEIGG